MRNLSENTTRNTQETVVSIIKKKGLDQVVIDIPCGSGAFTKKLISTGFKVYSSDIKNFTDVNKENFFVANMNTGLPFKDGTIDSIVCIDGIEHIERPFDFISECGRVLKLGGTLVITTPNTSSLRSRFRWFTTGFHNKCKAPLDETSVNPLHHITMVSYPELRYRLHRDVFEIQQVTTNRIKSISWLYGIFVPFFYLFTKLAFKKELKNESEKEIGKSVMKTLFSKPVLFGETLIVEAKKVEKPFHKLGF